VIILIVRLSLLLMLGAIANFLLAIVFDRLTLTHLAGLTSQLGSMLLLSAFSLFVLVGLGFMGKLIFAALCDYFSTRQRMERKLLFYIEKNNRLKQLFQFKKARLLYVNQQQRKRILKKADQKSVPS
jgi:hypothetical protein